jgi:hypothetical protein
MSQLKQITTGITDYCLKCGELSEFTERDGVWAWRHALLEAGDEHEASPEQLSLRVVTERYLAGER